MPTENSDPSFGKVELERPRRDRLSNVKRQERAPEGDRLISNLRLRAWPVQSVRKRRSGFPIAGRPWNPKSEVGFGFPSHDKFMRKTVRCDASDGAGLRPAHKPQEHLPSRGGAPNPLRSVRIDNSTDQPRHPSDIEHRLGVGVVFDAEDAGDVLGRDHQRLALGF